MRATDDRYAGERAQFDLAIRLIRHQARTHIISECTGFSQERIRKLYATYFKHQQGNRVRRKRGKSPSAVDFFFRNSRVQAEASALAGLFFVYGLVRLRSDLTTGPGAVRPGFAKGERFCRAFEDYLTLCPSGQLSFERAWSLQAALETGDGVLVADCVRCGALYVQDALALDPATCPGCRGRQSA
jgi:hypothetical protein